jgi:hypothetical protein
MSDRFTWRTYDVTTLMPPSWKSEIRRTAQLAVARTVRPHSVTSREADPSLPLHTLTVDGHDVRAQLPWLYNLYHDAFRSFAEREAREPVSCAQHDLYGAVLNVQQGSEMRYECHVDSNPIQGMLYVTDHPRGTGGDLVVANTISAASVKEVEHDCATIPPVAGHLLLFDGRQHAHYVRSLTAAGGQRIAVAMNFYTQSCPEAMRPPDLDTHLFGHGTAR